MVTIDKTKPVMITGATGYVAGWVVKELLDNGHTVHAPIRSPENPEKTKYLDALAENASGTIKYFKADLLEDGSYDEAAAGCELIIHTASPLINKVKDPQKSLVDPAVIGTRNVLNTAIKSNSVKRVVLTSSCGAIYGDAQDLKDYPNQIMTEEHWNTTSTLHHQSYSFSKVQAEKEAWKLAKSQSAWDLVVLNPSFVLGPGINPRSTSESFNIIRQLGDGTLKMGAPDFNIGAVDVRDLAVAHYNAGFLPTANGRNIISAENSNFLALSGMLEDKFGDNYPLPRRMIPMWLIWLAAPIYGFKRSVIYRNIGYEWKADNSKSEKELNIHYRPVKETIIDFFQQMVDTGVFKK